MKDMEPRKGTNRAHRGIMKRGARMEDGNSANSPMACNNSAGIKPGKSKANPRPKAPR